MPSAKSRVASSWIRSHVVGQLPRRARTKGIFDRHDDDDDDDDLEDDFNIFKREEPPKPKSAPAKPAPAKPSPPKPAPAKPDSGPGEGTLRRDPLFDEFLGEKYQGGEARVPNPNHETREKFPEVAFSTAMRDSGFRRHVHQEFERWKGDRKKKDEGGEHKRLEIGETVKHIGQLRVGDVIQSDRPDSPLRRITAVKDGEVWAVTTGEGGDTGEPSRLNVDVIVRGRHKRVADPATPSGKARKVERDKAERAERLKQLRERRERAKKQLEKKLERRKNAPEWARQQDELLDIALEGKVAHSQDLGGGVNTTVKRTLEHNGKRAQFVWKPASGERKDMLRYGVKPGTQYQREVASYNIDRLLGEGTVVPPTVSNGKGSYQAFQAGAQTFYSVYYGGGGKPPQSKVIESPDFARMHLLDLVTGHEDRHIGNMMFLDAPGGVRLFAIDNGLTLADTPHKTSTDNYRVVSQWTEIYDTHEMRRAVFDATRNIDEELHNRLKEVDHKEFVEAILASGLEEEGAILSALVRLSALQRNPRLLQQFEDDDDLRDDKITEPIARFLLASAQQPKDLLRDAGGPGPSFEDLQEIVKRALQQL